jgi:hypothetical protein
VTCSQRLDQPPLEWPVTKRAHGSPIALELLLERRDELRRQRLAARPVAARVGELVVAARHCAFRKT